MAGQRDIIQKMPPVTGNPALDDYLTYIAKRLSLLEVKDTEDGIIHFPNQSKCRITLSSNQVLLHNTITKIEFDTVDYDVQSEFDVTTNNRFNVTEDGYYLIINASNIYPLDDTKKSTVYIYKNGAAVVTDSMRSPMTNANMYHKAIAILSLSAGDYIEGFAFQYNGTSLYIGGGSAGSAINIHKIS